MTEEEKKASGTKDEGNKCFKSGQFPGAIAAYSKVCQRRCFGCEAVDSQALELITTLPTSPTQQKLYCDCLGNRAACRIQERDFEMAVDDCNLVRALELRQSWT